jgi:predicted dehydrogenase
MSMSKPIGIGIIGASPKRGWAIDAHIPAIKASPDLELRAVSTSREESARQAEAAFGVPAYAHHHELVSRPDVDLVVITVKVPHHHELVCAAIATGKAVLCEWPLGNGLDEAIDLEARARAAGVRNFVGLQARSAPEYNHIRDLIRDGYVGDVLSTSVIASGRRWGGEISPETTYLLDPANGATMLTIPFGHTIDAICYCLGEAAHLAAETATRRKTARVSGSEQVLPVGVADQILVSGLLQSGAPISMHYRGGMCAGTNFLWEINGTDGDLVVGAAFGHTQMTKLHVSGAKTGGKLAHLPTPAQYLWAPEGTPDNTALNVAQAYALIVQDLRDGGRRAPDFAEAVLRHRMLACIERAAETGTRQTYL